MEQKNDLKIYHQAALQISTLNKENFKQKIPYDDELKKQKNEIKKLFFTATKLGKLDEKLKKSKINQDIEDYQDYYKDIKKVFQENIYPQYPALKTIAGEIEKDFDQDKLITETESKFWRKKAKLNHAISVYIGSGALASVGYSVGYKNFELMLSAGYLTYKETIEEMTNSTTYKRDAVPVSLRLFFSPFKFALFEPYGFAGGAYYNGITNYTSVKMILAGAGLRFMKYFFAEACWAVTKDANSPMIGLGVRFRF